MSWYNSDGLLVRFDKEKVVVAAGGEYPGAGALRTVEFKIDISTLTTSSALIAGEGIIIPRNARIDSVDVYTETVAATITSVSVGLIRIDRSTTTGLSTTGLVNGLVVASMSTSGEKTTIIPEGTYAGSLVGTTLAYPGLPVAQIAGSTGTGLIRVRVHLFVPGKDTNVTNY
jgi:hypothetical protein